MEFETVSRLRDRIDSSDVVAALILAGVLTVFGADVTEIAMIASIVVITPLAEEVIFDKFDIDPALAQIAFGLFAVAGGIVQLRDGNLFWVGGVLLTVGCWICLDGLYARRTDDTSDIDKEELSEDEVHLIALHNSWLLKELQEADRPLTKAELCDRTGLLEDDFERLLKVHGDSGPIERIGTGYAIDDREMGAGGIARSIGRRLCRPIRLFRPAG
ncbi:hypothetical protein [Natrinema sp. 74]|uniref:hypothetical protein n=1 Tax=Natrinema sp. 74 TaxID=3384159 RepID=UPI0038D35F13